MKYTITSILAILIISNFTYGINNISRVQYRDIWSSLAIEQMCQFKIPASIKLAQAILESSSGDSYLAKSANNHFGIKCHRWQGEAIYLNDDKKGECFRVYEKVEDSYSDHSKFLTNNKRYDFLFQYQIDDYKSWAIGLKKAGYATDPRYPKLLISIIEKLELFKFDSYTEIKRRPKILKNSLKGEENLTELNFLKSTDDYASFSLVKIKEIDLIQSLFLREEDLF